MEPPSLSEILDFCELSYDDLDQACSKEDDTEIAGHLGRWREVVPHLGLDEDDVDEIEVEGRTEAERKLKAVRKWRSKYGYRATYKAVVKILVKLKKMDAAQEICQLVKSHSSSGSLTQTRARASSQTSSDAPGRKSAQLQPLAPIPSRDCRVLGVLSEQQLFDLTADFADLCAKIVPLLAQAVSADALKSYLRKYRHPISKVPYIDPMVYRDCTSTEEILDVLEQQCYFHAIQVSLLGRIIGCYGCDKCKHLMEEYEEKVSTSAALSRRRDFPSDSKIDASRDTKKITVMVVGDPDTFSLQDVKNIKSALEIATGVSSDMITLVQYYAGSVVLIFLVPTSTTECFLALSSDPKHLNSYGIIKIEVDDVVIIIPSQLHGATASAEVVSMARRLEKLSITEIEPTQLVAKLKRAPVDVSFVPPGCKRVPEVQALLWSFDFLVQDIQGPASFADRALSAGLISSPTRQLATDQAMLRTERNTVILTDILNHVCQEPASIKVFLQVLKSQQDYVSLATKVEYVLEHVKSGVKIDNERVKSLGQRLLKNITGESESLAWCKATEDGLMHIAIGFYFNTSLKSLDLRGNDIGDENALYLEHALRRNRTLETLNLSDCRLTPYGTMCIARGLEANTSLITMDLSGSTVGDDGAMYLGVVLQQYSRLESLNLQNCGLTADGLKLIAHGLEANTSLDTLELNGSAVGDEGAVYFEQVLRQNKTLEILNLSDCGITAHGVKHIANGLVVNTSLVALDLSRNAIGDEGVRSLGSALRANKSLEILHLAGCKMGLRGVQWITRLLESDTYLEELTLTYGDLNKDSLSFEVERSDQHAILVALNRLKWLALAKGINLK